jgi:hypothetical protein
VGQITVVSGCHPEGFQRYGAKFLETFEYYWPKHIKLAFYSEKPIRKIGRCERRSLWDCPGQKEFIEENLANPVAHGQEPHPNWSKKDHRNFKDAGYTFRFQAVRFSRQLFIPEHAVSLMSDDDIFVWMDADVVSYAPVPADMVERFLAGRDLVSLGRDDSATELGFWAIRINERSRALVQSMAESCRSGEIFSLKEWHSGFVFDHYVAKAKQAGLTHRNLTSSGSGHVWFQCELGQYTDHLKGEWRKNRGYSSERSIL